MDESEPERPAPLSPGDVLSVQITGDESPGAATVLIDRMGFVHLPLAGDVRVAGLGLSDAEKALEQAMRGYERFARVTLAITDAHARYATVVGAVERAGNVPLVGDARLADVLAAVGGVKSSSSEERLVPLGDLDGARLMRQGHALPVQVKRALEGELRHNVRVRPGDILYVPPALASRVAVLGHVDRPRTFAFHEGMRLTEVLAGAGGFSRSADAADIRIVRGGYAAPRVYVADAKALFAGQGPDIVLAPGDVVFVTEHWFATVGDVLERLVPATATAALLTSVVVRTP